MTPEIATRRAMVRQTVESALVDTRRRLQSAGIESAAQEAIWLIEHALRLSGLYQILNRNRSLSEHDLAKVNECVTRRAAREPLQYILGTQEFCGLQFHVDPTVLIPRPETELVVKEVVRRLPRGGSPTIVDVGTGSGCLAVTLARSVCNGKFLATDLSGQALETAKRNARRHTVETSITWLEGDVLVPLAGVCCEGTVTAIVANLPYIRESEWAGLQPEVSRYEPRMALVAGPRGTELHERLLDEAVSYLIPGGFLAMEVGQGQSSGLCVTIEAMSAYARVDVVPDEAGIDRLVIVERAG
jgi:release factor glutamine methyltransferase